MIQRLAGLEPSSDRISHRHLVLFMLDNPDYLEEWFVPDGERTQALQEQHWKNARSAAKGGNITNQTWKWEFCSAEDLPKHSSNVLVRYGLVNCWRKLSSVVGGQP